MSHPIVSTPRQADFLAIPETPIVYWLRARFFELLQSPQRLRNVAEVKQGLATADDERFTRCFWEVQSFGVVQDSKPVSGRWFWFAKGGRYQKWVGLEWLVVDWENTGQRIRQFPNAVIRNETYYFRPGLTYTPIARGSLGVRILRDAVFGHKGSFILPTKLGELALSSILNTRISSFLTRTVSQTLGFEVSHLQAAPLPEVVPEQSPQLAAAGTSLKGLLVATDPTERGFRLLSLEAPACDGLIARWSATQEGTLAREALLHTLEGVNEREVFAAYRLDEEDARAVLDETGTPAGWYPLIAGYDALPPLPDGLSVPGGLMVHLAQHERRAFAPTDLARLKTRLRTLYQAGPGAKVEAEEGADANGEEEDEQEVALGARIPIPAETFLEELSQKLEVHPISVYWLLKELHEQEGLVSPPELKRHLEDYASITVLRLLGYRWPEQDRYEREHGPILDPALVVEDGIIPLVPCGDQPTALERVRMCLERDFGPEGAEQSEREFRQWVGHDLDDWLRRDFFKRHVQQFKQRPIAWHLVSPERTFEAFVLYHKLSRATLQKLRAQYAGGLIARLRAEQERARQRGATAEVSQLQLQIEDVEEFRARLEKIERGDGLEYRVRCRWKGEEESGRPGPYAPDIDDGVKVNIRPFQEAGLLPVKEVIRKW